MSSKTIFDKKNILVAGGAGFIGSHLCDELIKGNKVICIDNMLTGDDTNIAHLLRDPNFIFIKHDIIEPIDLERQPELERFRLEFQGLQAIYFLASPASPKAHKKFPLETMLANSCGLRNCLDLAVKYKAQIVYASAPTVYGDASGEKLVKENFNGVFNQLQEDACYGEAVRFGETLVDNYRRVHNLDAKMVRIFNCYGPRMGLNDGRFIPEAIRAALFGETISILTGKKTAASHVYISDVIKALTKIMETAEAGPINIGSDWPVSLEEVAKKIVSITGSNSAVERKEGESTISLMTPDISSAKEKLGWFPIVLLDEGLAETVDYLRAQKGVLEPENQFSKLR